MPKPKPPKPAPPIPAPAGSVVGDRFWQDGREIQLQKHETDFVTFERQTADSATPAIDAVPAELSGEVRGASRRAGAGLRGSATLFRHAAAKASDRDALMAATRKDRPEIVASHVYRNAEAPDEEILFQGDILITLESPNDETLNALTTKYQLEERGTMGGSFVVAVKAATGMNCIKAANLIRNEPGVQEASPLPMIQMKLAGAAPALFPRQWHLNASQIGSPQLSADADIDVPEAWQITSGSPGVVIAVIDDGFDLTHPALRSARLADGAIDFSDLDAVPEAAGLDFHGTPVAALILGQGGAIRGVAPGCSLLPVRISFGGAGAAIDMVEVFRHVSARADIVNCSFGIPPTATGLPSAFRNELASLARSGGRSGRGLVMVFAAGNDDSPTFLPGVQNVNGVKFVKSDGAVGTIPAGVTVHGGYPEIPGIIAVAAMSSLKRKSGFSNWGPQIAVAAPSNNRHGLQGVLPPFAGPFPGLGLVTASNRTGHGRSFAPLPDNPFTPGVAENDYTDRFGGTSGAAPIVAGVCGLILSANPNLSAADVRQIVMSTADKNLDPALDFPGDPNVQGKSGAFVSGASQWFGAGKVNAHRAVRRARALLNPAPTSLVVTQPAGPFDLPQMHVGDSVTITFRKSVPPAVVVAPSTPPAAITIQKISESNTEVAFRVTFVQVRVSVTAAFVPAFLKDPTGTFPIGDKYDVQEANNQTGSVRNFLILASEISSFSLDYEVIG